jgi:hypothetical protein
MLHVPPAGLPGFRVAVELRLSGLIEPEATDTEGSGFTESVAMLDALVAPPFAQVVTTWNSTTGLTL